MDLLLDIIGQGSGQVFNQAEVVQPLEEIELEEIENAEIEQLRVPLEDKLTAIGLQPITKLSLRYENTLNALCRREDISLIETSREDLDESQVFKFDVSLQPPGIFCWKSCCERKASFKRNGVDVFYIKWCHCCEHRRMNPQGEVYLSSNQLIGWITYNGTVGSDSIIVDNLSASFFKVTSSSSTFGYTVKTDSGTTVATTEGTSGQMSRWGWLWNQFEFEYSILVEPLPGTAKVVILGLLFMLVEKEQEKSARRMRMIYTALVLLFLFMFGAIPLAILEFMPGKSQGKDDDTTTTPTSLTEYPFN